MANRFASWFLTVYPGAAARRTVMAEYAALRSYKHALADIALRGFAFRTSHVPGDAYTTAYNEGRRSLALEIAELTNMPFEQLAHLVEPQQRNAK